MNYSSLIDKYLDGLLEGKELEKFEDELIRNPEFASAFERIKKLNQIIKRFYTLIYTDPDLAEKITELEGTPEGISIDSIIERFGSKDTDIKNIDLQNFKTRLKTVISKEKNKRIRKETTVHKIKKWYVAAAMIIILLSVSSIYLITSKLNNPDRIYKQYYNPLYIGLFTRSAQQLNVDSLLFLGYYEYLKGQYELAIKVFDKVPSESDYSNIAHILTGISYMEIDQFEDAVKEFEDVSNARLLEDTAHWYLGLCYLKSGNIIKANAIFNKIVLNNEGYKTKAQEILKKTLVLERKSKERIKK